MKKIVPVLSIIGLSASILCAILLFQSDKGFSFFFKSLFIFTSLFVISAAIQTSNFNKVISIISLICFGGTILIFSATDLYFTLWNFVLAGHVLLIGYTFYKKEKTIQINTIQRITLASVIVFIATFTAMLLLKSQNELISTCLFFILAVTSILLVVSKITSLLRQK